MRASASGGPALTQGRARLLALGLFAFACARQATAQTRQTPAAVQHYFDLVRPLFSADRAYEQVAFMDQYFRWPGNTGFNASIHRVEETLKAAGYVEQSKAPAGATLTYRIEHRPMKQPAWEPVDASVTIVGERQPVLSFATNRNMIAINSFSTSDTGVVAELVDVGKGTANDYKTSVAGKIVLTQTAVGRAFTQAVQQKGAVGVLAYSLPAYTQPEKN